VIPVGRVPFRAARHALKKTWERAHARSRGPTRAPTTQRRWRSPCAGGSIDDRGVHKAFSVCTRAASGVLKMKILNFVFKIFFDESVSVGYKSVWSVSLYGLFGLFGQ
jgi:hypothetical protein